MSDKELTIVPAIDGGYIVVGNPGPNRGYVSEYKFAGELKACLVYIERQYSPLVAMVCDDEFKVGDRVKYTGDVSDHYKGLTGVVVNADYTDSIQVQFDSPKFITPRGVFACNLSHA